MGKTKSRTNAAEGSTRADRKFDKKLKFYELVRSAVAPKVITKEKQKRRRSRQKKMKAYDMSSLSNCLPDIKTSSESKPIELKFNSKNRNKLVVHESKRLSEVTSNSDFQSDPLGAIYQHLLKTQPIGDEKAKTKVKKTGKCKAKKKKSKKVASQQSMEF